MGHPPDFFGPEEQYAKLGIGLSLSSAATINSAANQDANGTALGMASYLRAPIETAATSGGWTMSKYIPFAGIFLDGTAAVHDYNQTMSDYGDCMEHY